MAESVDCDLDKHFEEQQMLEMISVCCGAAVYMVLDDDVCMECQNTCEIISKGDWLYNQRIDAECDAADAKKELERDND